MSVIEIEFLRLNGRFPVSQESAVQFATESRIHMGLAVQNLEASVAFYRELFGQEPTKTRPHYAKFEVAEPPVNLSLNEVGGETGPNNAVAHFGIQVKSTAAVQTAATRLTEAGIGTKIEEEVTCCYAVQNKVWASDPDGNKWEVYVVLNNDGRHHHSSQGECCAATPAAADTVQRSDAVAAQPGGCCPAIPAVVDAVRRADVAAAQRALESSGGSSACSCLDQPSASH